MGLRQSELFSPDLSGEQMMPSTLGQKMPHSFLIPDFTGIFAHIFHIKVNSIRIYSSSTVMGLYRLT